MSGQETPQSQEAVQTPLDCQSAAGSALFDMVEELKGELTSLKGEVLDLRGRLLADQAGAGPVESDQGTVPDAESFAVERELAGASTKPVPEDFGTPYVDLPVVPTGSAPESEETLKLSSELSGVVDAIEVEKLALDDNPETSEPLNEGLSTEEMDALFVATSQLGSRDAHSSNLSDEQGAEGETPPTPVPPLVPNPSPATNPERPNGATLLTEEEILALLAEAKGDPKVLPAAEKPEPGPPKSPEELEAELVSADEIKEMLGIKSQEDDTEPAQNSQADEALAVEGQLTEVGLVLEQGLTVTAGFGSDDAPDLNTVDPSAVARVPGLLAAAALALPVCVVDDKLHCLCIEPIDQEALGAIATAVGVEVVPHSGDPIRVLAELRARYGDGDEAIAREPAPVPPVSLVRRLLAKLTRRPA